MLDPSFIERGLGRLADNVRSTISLVEKSLSKLADLFGDIAKRIARFVWNSACQIVRLSAYSLILASVFLAPVFVGSGFHEITFLPFIATKIIGWLGVVIAVCFLILMIGLMAAPNDSSKDNKKHTTIWFHIFNILMLIAIGLANQWHYKFKSPALRLTQAYMEFVSSFADDPQKWLANHTQSMTRMREAIPGTRSNSPSKEDSSNGSAGAKSLDRPGNENSGTLVIQGLAGTEVLIDGQSKGVINIQGDLAVTGVPVGSHTVLCRKNGYQDFQISVEVKAGQSKIFPVALKGAKGNLIIQTEPDAKVMIDGSEHGSAGSNGYIKIYDLAVGAHQVIVRKSGFSEKHFSTDLTSGQTANVQALLNWNGGYLTIRANPSGTIINISGLREFSGEWFDVPFPAGTYIITASHTGMKTETRTVMVQAGQHVAIDFNLSPDSFLGPAAHMHFTLPSRSDHRPTD